MYRCLVIAVRLIVNVVVAVAAVNVGESVRPKPNEIRAVAGTSYWNAPAPVATMNCPSDPATPSVLKSSNTAPNAWTPEPITRPRFVRAADAVVPPVPPTLIANVEVDTMPL